MFPEELLLAFPEGLPVIDWSSHSSIMMAIPTISLMADGPDWSSY